MDADEASAYLGMGIRALYRLIDRGDLPAYRIGGTIRLRRHELDAYLERARLGARRSYRPTKRGDPLRGHTGNRFHSSRRAPRTAKRPRSRPPA
jgi:excisionase family DNA binding protein